MTESGPTATGHLQQGVVNILLLVVDRLGLGPLTRDAQAVIEPVDADDPLGAEQVALAMAKRPTGPQPQTAMTSPGLMSHISAPM